MHYLGFLVNLKIYKYGILFTLKLHGETGFFYQIDNKDLVNWKKHSNILDTTIVNWVRKALWAPSTIKKDGRYYVFFGANDIQSPVSPWWNPEIHTEGETGGIGLTVADKPQGPYEDYLGKPLINEIHHGAQPINQFVFRDHNGQHYL